MIDHRRASRAERRRYRAHAGLLRLLGAAFLLAVLALAWAAADGPVLPGLFDGTRDGPG